MDGLINAIIDAIMKYAKDNIKDDILLALQQSQKERDGRVQRIIDGKAKSRKKHGRPQVSTDMGSQKEGYIAGHPGEWQGL